MPSTAYRAQKSKYRITIELEALDDFCPTNIDFNKVFSLHGAERVTFRYVENLSTPDRYSA